MTANELRRKYIEFFVKQCGHKEISSASIIPENDPTVLFTTAGMHPLVPYLIGEPHPAGKRLTDVQKCVRTDDIDEVGDMTHCTFFEMLGNWSLGDYFKKEAIEFSYKFLTLPDEKGGLGFDIKNLAVSCFAGDSDAPRDDEAANAWKSFGISEERIAFLPKKNNWWGPAGKTGPCGPDTEMFYWTGEGVAPKKFDPDDANWVEIWNDVFMQYNKTAEGKYEPLKQTNVDTGMGLERTFAILQGKKSCFETELFADALNLIKRLSNKSDDISELEIEHRERIIADHLRAVTFIMGDDLGVVPSNVDQGYIVRRLIRRAMMSGRFLGIKENFTDKIAQIYINIYKDTYPELERNSNRILGELKKEEDKFRKLLEKGLIEIDKMIEKWKQEPRMAHGIDPNIDLPPSKAYVNALNPKWAFDLYQTYGWPLELINEVLARHALLIDEQEFKKLFDEAYKKHQEMSRAGALQKFSGGLADHSEQVNKLHTATHLLNQALRQVLGDHVYQKGSNITAERLRFDFSHPQKVTPEELAKIEAIVNEQIKANLPINCDEMAVDEAKSKGAIGVFDAKYGDKVKVYFMGDFSKEICGGPHANNTGDLKSFKILKEEAVASGIRRIKAVIG